MIGQVANQQQNGSSNLTSSLQNKAWQRLIREKKALTEDSPLLDTNIKTAIIKEITYKEASSIILEYEWLGTMARSKKHYGIFFEGFLAGAVCYSQCDGWTHRTVLKYGADLAKTWVLSRGACVHWAHTNSASKLISFSLKLLNNTEKAEIVIAYSDYEAGELGTVYQATNWVHLGIASNSYKGFISPSGEKFHRNIIYDIRRKEGTLKTKSWTQQVKELIDHGWTTYDIVGKRRYVYPFTTALRNIILVDAKLYPKRVAV